MNLKKFERIQAAIRLFNPPNFLNNLKVKLDRSINLEFETIASKNLL